LFPIRVPVREREWQAEDERNVLAGPGEPDHGPCENGVPRRSPLGRPEQGRGSEQDEKKREEVGITHVLGGEHVQGVGRDEQTGQEPDASAEE